MTTDFHHNIFYYYKGAQESDACRERQLENNTTKALINTLEHTDQQVARRFLAWLGIESDGGEARYLLQRATIGEEHIRRRHQRLLLGLMPAKTEAIENVSEASGKITSLPDAWIYGGDFVVLIESKVVGGLDGDQMERHLRILDSDGRTLPRRVDRTWVEVHRFFCGLAAELTGSDRWIVEQLTEFLEWTSMAGFTGFTDGMFDYFFVRQDDETRVWVRDAVTGFAEEVWKELVTLHPFYEGYDVGTLRLTDDHAWVAFGPKDSSYRQYAHPTLTVDADGIEVFVNVELKASIEKLKARAAENWQGFQAVIGCLDLGDDLYVQIAERTQRQASIYDYHPVARIQVPYLKDTSLGEHGFQYLRTLLEQIPLPYFTVRKRLDRQRVRMLSENEQGRSLIAEVVRTIKAFHPLTSYINEAK